MLAIAFPWESDYLVQPTLREGITLGQKEKEQTIGALETVSHNSDTQISVDKNRMELNSSQ